MTDPELPGAVPPPPSSPVPPTLPPDAPPTLPPDAPPPPVEATTQMPVTQAGAGAGQPPGGVPPRFDYGQAGRPAPKPPWYKRPGPLAALLIVLLAIGGLVAWLLLSGGDDDEPASPDSSRLTIDARDDRGAALDRGFLIEVTGPVGSEAAYRWLSPADAAPGQITGDVTGADGRVVFEWQPDETVTEPDDWAATVRLTESVPAGWTPAGPLIECKLQRVGQSDSVVSMSAEVSAAEADADREVAYTFPNYSFLPGDAVSCTLTSTAPVETSTTSTTEPDISTTEVETTTTEALPTTVPEVTVPPQPEATLWDVIDNSPDLSELKALIELAGLRDVLSDPNATLTFLAPSNQAIRNAMSGVGAPDFTNPSVVESILLTHLDSTRVLLAVQLFGLQPPEFTVDNPGPHPIDTSANPPTIGGAEVLVADVEASNGVLHVIDRVLLPAELPD